MTGFDLDFFNDSFFNRLTRPVIKNDPFSSFFNSRMITENVYHNDDGSITLKLNFAGHDKDNIVIDFNENSKILKAYAKEKLNNGDTVTKLSYQYKLGQNVTKDSIKASHNNGLLEITVTGSELNDKNSTVNIEIT